MTSKIQDSMKDLESVLSSMCYPFNQEEEDDILLKSLSKLLPPNSSWSVLLDIREIAEKSKKALKSCPHSLRLLSYHNSNISFACHICNNNFGDASLAETEEPDQDLEVVEEEIESEATNDRKDAESSPPTEEKTESDEEIDQLLMDTPEKEKEGNDRSTNISTSGTLKLRALSELLETTSPLPSFTSSRLDEGTNPMQSIPLYEADLTLTDERAASPPPVSYSLQIFNSSGSGRVRSPVLRPGVSSAPALVRTVTAVRVSRPSTTLISVRPPQPQLQASRVRPAGAQYHGPRASASTISLNQSRPGGKVRAKLVTVPHGQPYPQHSLMSSSAPLQLVQHRAPTPPQVNLVQHRLPPQVQQFNINQHRAQHPTQQVHPLPGHHQQHQQRPLYTDPRLPAGWNRIINVLPNGSCSVNILDNKGRVFRNRQELQNYIKTSGQIAVVNPSGEIGVVNPNKIDFSIFGEYL